MPFGVIRGSMVGNRFVQRRRRVTAKKHTVRAVEKKVTRLSKQVRPEVKYDTDAINLAIPTGTSFVPGPDIARGTALNQRSGSKIQGVGLEFDYYLFNTAGAAPAYATSPFVVRVLIICDIRANQQLFNPANVFDSNSLIPGEPFHFTSQRNREYMNRYRVIYDKTHVIGPELLQGAVGVTSLGDNNRNYIVRRNKLRHKQKIIFTEAGAAGTPAETIQGHYYLGLFCTLGPPGVPQPSINSTLRLLYTDV